VRFATDIARAKIGCRLTPGSADDLSNIALPAIPATHSILLEWFIKYKGPYTPIGSASFFVMRNAVASQLLYNLSYITAPRRFEYWILGVGWDTTSSSPLPIVGPVYYGAFLIDRTNTLKRMWANGGVSINAALVQDPNFNTINNQLYWGSGPAMANINLDVTYIVLRLTTLNGIPADIDAAIKRMYARPMLLDASLQAVAVIASQWDFEDVAYGTGAITTVADHGVVGGFPLTSSVDYRPLLVEVEKP